MGPDASTPARLCETQREDNRDATAGIIEALESIKHKAAATSRIYLCSPLLHFCQVGPSLCFIEDAQGYRH